MEPVTVEKVSIVEGRNACLHGGKCREGTSTFKFYKNGVLKFIGCYYKKEKNIDVSDFDKVEAYVLGYEPAVLEAKRDNIISLCQRKTVTMFTFDLSDKNTIDIDNDMQICRSLSKYEEYEDASNVFSDSSLEEDSSEGDSD